MKKLFIYAAILLGICLTGCEDPIHVDTETAPPRLVVDALIAWEKGTAGNEQKIKLTTTTNYYNTNPPAVSGATVFITNSASTVFDFIETPGTGEYVCSTFVPQIDETYTLTVIHDGQTITATETLKGVPVIDYIAQELTPGIGGEEDVIDVKPYFTDPGNTTDFYMFRFKSNITAIPEYSVSDDEFFQGNQIFWLYSNEDTKPGDVIDIKLYGISQRYFAYWEKLSNIVTSNGPFNTPPGTLRGNLVNTTNPGNYVLGYFNLSETDTEVYVVQ